MKRLLIGRENHPASDDKIVQVAAANNKISKFSLILIYFDIFMALSCRRRLTSAR